MRIKEYGVEYRTLSNFWIFSEKTIEWVYEQTRKALEFVKDGHFLEDLSIPNCINTGDMNEQMRICRTYGLA